MHEWMVECLDGSINWMDGWMDGYTIQVHISPLYIHKHNVQSFYFVHLIYEQKICIYKRKIDTMKKKTCIRCPYKIHWFHATTFQKSIIKQHPSGKAIAKNLLCKQDEFE